MDKSVVPFECSYWTNFVSTLIALSLQKKLLSTLWWRERSSSSLIDHHPNVFLHFARYTQSSICSAMFFPLPLRYENTHQRPFSNANLHIQNVSRTPKTFCREVGQWPKDLAQLNGTFKWNVECKIIESVFSFNSGNSLLYSIHSGSKLDHKSRFENAIKMELQSLAGHEEWSIFTQVTLYNLDSRSYFWSSFDDLLTWGLI